ncbi:disulfide bond formation protein DsbD [Kordiimonas sediminis]|uniref:Disulfide bond formation protein DsbD n=1 Tax=Kordiimonas sediminis TaxID=1735581 RepID=A0A919ATX8_9PROT|nr:thioredoxin domain-containing protein [Kordiimonas sediminis]GHF24814.1 disulfide bond formation protein DsbD [Kordiimonas sediminis]
MKKIAVLAGIALFVTACSEAEEASVENSEVQPEVKAMATSAAPDAPASAAQQSDMTYGDIVYGSPDAPVEIIEYASLTCVHCGTFANTIFPTIKEKYIDTGKVRFIYRHMEGNRVGLAASTVARCGNDEETKALVKALFAKQSQWLQSQNPLDGMASVLLRYGVSRTKFDRCLSNTEMHKEIVEQSRHGTDAYNVTAIPTLIVNGAKADDYRLEPLSKMIEDAL